MPTISDCCRPCPTTQTVNVPGAQGNAGTNGTNGLNAFTITTANFTVPALGANVTVNVADSSWMVPGQYIFVQGAGLFTVSSVPNTTSAILTYLNIGANGQTGANVPSGNGVSPGGAPVSVLPSINSYVLGGSQALTTTPTQALTSSVVLPAGTYLLFATVRLDYVAATFSTQRVATAILRCTNNTVADIANAVANAKTDITTLKTATMAYLALPAVQYTATANDNIQLYISLDNTPYAGALHVVETSILAIQLF